MSRKRFSERDVLRTLVEGGVIIPCGCGCGNAITLDDLSTPKGVQRDHTIPLALG